MTTITPPLSQLLKATCFLLMLLPLVDMIDDKEGRSGSSSKSRTILDTGQVHQKIDNGTATATVLALGEGIPGSTVGTFLGSSATDLAANSWFSLSPTKMVQGGPSPSVSSVQTTTGLSSTRAFSRETTRNSLTSFLPVSTKRHRHVPTSLMTTVITATIASSSSQESSTLLLPSLSPVSSAAAATQLSFHDSEQSPRSNINSKVKEKGLSNHQRKSPLMEVEPPVSLAVSSSSSSSAKNQGPYFESNKTTINVSAREGQTVLLDCTVILLQGRMVSWLRRRKDSLQLLTVGNTTYLKDSRWALRFRYPNNWRLGIDSVKKDDEGEYQCQLSTFPIQLLIYHLKVIAPAVIILDENGNTNAERHYKVDSSLHLTCKASHVDKASGNKVTWLKGGRALPLSDTRIQVKFSTNPANGDVTAYLSVSSMHKGDSGNYTCRASSMATSTIVVHVLNGELPAAVQHESCANNRLPLSSGLLLTLAAAVTMMTTIMSSFSSSVCFPFSLLVSTTTLR